LPLFCVSDSSTLWSGRAGTKVQFLRAALSRGIAAASELGNHFGGAPADVADRTEANLNLWRLGAVGEDAAIVKYVPSKSAQEGFQVGTLLFGEADVEACIIEVEYRIEIGCGTVVEIRSAGGETM
jgi:hypothetical protein